MKFKSVMFVIVIVSLCGLYAIFMRKHSSISSNGISKFDHSTLVFKTLSSYKKDCTFHSCFNVPNCQSRTENKVTIGIHPYQQKISREHFTSYRSVKESDHFTNDYLDACITILFMDATNDSSSQNRVSVRNGSDTETNYLIFDFAAQYTSLVKLPIGHSMIASGAMTEENYRYSYDISIPMFNPLTAHLHLKYEARSRLFVITQVAIPVELRHALEKVAHGRKDFLILKNCNRMSGSYFKRCSGKEVYDYPQILKSAKFCGIVASRYPIEQTALYDAMKAGCIPVFLGKTYVLPFSEVLDWKRCSIHVLDHQLPNLPAVLERFSNSELLFLRRHLRHFFQSYMSNVRKITMTTLRIINDRAVSHAARTYVEWNEPMSIRRQMPPSPLFYPLSAPHSRGFTAVLLTFNRFPQLCRLLRRLAPTPSLRRIVVVWNNQEMAPPPISEWPPLGKSVTIIRSLRNSLNNRFSPFEEIDTEAVLSMDDDLDMLTPDELEFGFRLWSLHTDRLVGIPSRLHWQDNITGAWRYDSEWKSELSIVLTGAAFFHKYYGYLYRTRMPGEVTRYVDEKMMCEDIAMNFLVAHLTGKAALKVTPRKKFRCPTCVNSSSSLRTVRRLHERSLCVANFAKYFGGRVPMRTVDFRVDPLLMGVSTERSIDAYRNVGRL